MSKIELMLLSSHFAVCRMEPDAAAAQAIALPPVLELFCVTRTPDEVSIVCSEDAAPNGAKVEPGWRALKVAGPLDFSLVGILAGLAGALAENGISLFALSTYNTDYILVRGADLSAALGALRRAGYVVSLPPGSDRI